MDLFTKADILENGHLTYTEFVAAVISKSKQIFNDISLSLFFANADTNKDKKLSMDDITAYVNLQFKYRKDIDDKIKQKIIDTFKEF